MSIYNLPTIVIFLIFIITIPVLAVIGMLIFKSFDLEYIKCSQQNPLVAILIGISSIFLGVTVSFLIVTVWNNYTQTSLNSQQEAQSIFILYENATFLSNADHIKELIIQYLEYIINVEYPELKNGTVTLFGAQILGKLQSAIYAYTPNGDKETSIYNNMIAELNKIVGLRVDRIHNGTAGLNNIIWGICIFDSIIIIVITWFLTCEKLFHYVLVVIISLFIAAGLFLIFILSYPFKGQSGLTAKPFQEALQAIKNDVK